MWEHIRAAGRTAWMLVGLIVLAYLVGYVVWYFRVIVPPLVLAAAIVFVLNPIVNWAAGKGIPRVGGAALAYLIVVGILGVIVVLIIPVASDAGDLTTEFTQLGDDLEDWWDVQAAKSVRDDWPVEVPTWQDLGDDISDSGSDQSIGESISLAREVAGSIFDAVLLAFLAPIVAFYLLVDLPHVAASADSLVPGAAKDQVHLVSRRLNRAIGGFFRGQLIVAFIVGVMSSAGLWAIGLPFWFIVGMLAGVFNVIPLIGPWVGGALGVVVAFAAGDGTTQAIWVVVVMVVAQQIDNHFVSPVVMQRTVHLHPVAVIMALLAGGTLFGFFGLFLAVPTAAVLKIIASHLWRTYVLGQSFDEIADVWESQDSAPAVGMVEIVGDQESAVHAPSGPGDDDGGTGAGDE
ncbi:MAG: AI-2E family transporter [Acidimicrobiales bacterium]